MPKLLAGGISRDVKAILFDKDGTLMDFMYTWGRWSERLLASYSARLLPGSMGEPAHAMKRLLGIGPTMDGSNALDYDRNGPLAMGTVDDLLAILAWQGYQSGLSWATAKEAAFESKRIADEAVEAERAVKLLPGVLPFLENCANAGIRLAVVTADETAAAEKHLAWLGIRRHFATCVGTDQVGRGKPFPDMAELACRKLNVAPIEAAVIGDTNGDMRMAKAAGAALAIGLRDAGASHEELPDADLRIASFAELVIE